MRLAPTRQDEPQRMGLHFLSSSISRRSSVASSLGRSDRGGGCELFFAVAGTPSSRERAQDLRRDDRRGTFLFVEPCEADAQHWTGAGANCRTGRRSPERDAANDRPHPPPGPAIPCHSAWTTYLLGVQTAFEVPTANRSRSVPVSRSAPMGSDRGNEPPCRSLRGRLHHRTGAVLGRPIDAPRIDCDGERTVLSRG